MLTHIVCFKYKRETSETTREDHRSRLRGLTGLPGVVELTVGVDIVRSARSYDTALVVVFVDRGALDEYQRDPHHVPVAQYGASLCEHIATVDFLQA